MSACRSRTSGRLKVPDSLSDEKVLFLSDIFPTGYMAAENCNIEPGDTIAVWGCGPVGQFAIRSAFLLGAERVIAIDSVPDRLALAARTARPRSIDYTSESTSTTQSGRMTGGPGTRCLHRRGRAGGARHDARRRVRPRQESHDMATDRPHALRQAIHCCRKGGTVSIAGVYGGFARQVPAGPAFDKGLTFKMGQTHIHKYMRRCSSESSAARSIPSFIITHRVRLDDAPRRLRTFRDNRTTCIKVVLNRAASPGDDMNRKDRRW